MNIVDSNKVSISLLWCFSIHLQCIIYKKNKMAESQRFLEPLPLNYSLAKRKLRILIFWLLVFFDSFLLPIGLYYLLTRTTTWSSTTSTLTARLYCDKI